jgi:hypothetical protein
VEFSIYLYGPKMFGKSRDIEKENPFNYLLFIQLILGIQKILN